MICNFYAAVFFQANATFNGSYVYINSIAQFFNNAIFISNINVDGNVNHMLTDSSINFNQNVAATETNSKIFHDSISGLNVQNTNTTSATYIRLNSTGNINLQSTG